MYYPLSKAEEGLFVASQSGTDAYNLANVIPLGTKYSLADVKKALKQVFACHSYLFTQLVYDEEGSVKKVIKENEIEVFFEKVEKIEIHSLPYELIEKPLYRFGLYSLNGENYFYFDFHHIIMDGTSLALFIRDFFSALEGKELAKEKYTANDFSLEEKISEEDKAYFENKYSGLEVDSSLVEDHKKDDIAYGNIREKITLHDSEVKALTKKLGIKTSSFFLGGFAYLLSKINMEEEVLFLTVHNARTLQVKESYGSYVKTLPFYVQIKQDDIATYFKDVNDEWSNHIKHLNYPFSLMNQEWGVTSDVLIAYQGDYFYRGCLDGKEVDVIPQLRKDGKEKLAIEIHRDHDDFILWVEYRKDLYRESTIAHLIEMYDHLLHELLKKTSLSDVNMVSDKELERLDSFNVHDISYIDLNRTILDEFIDAVKKYPNNTAVVFKDHSYTYAETDKISTRIANELIRLGAGKEKVVSILIHKSEFIALASLGVIKSNAAYQPLDPTYPVERLSFMVEDASSIILIADDDLYDLIPDFKGIKIKSSALLSFADDTPIKNKPKPEDLFIMLYTSGSTGKPKGVMLEHKNIHTFTQFYKKTYHIDDKSHISAYASYGFDADMMDLYPTLTSGATLFVIPDEMRLNLVELGNYFEENKITHSFITTQVGRQFISEIQPKSLKYFLVGGEKLVPIQPPEGIEFINLYGPTEGTVACTGFKVDKEYYRIPIGKGYETYKCYVLDKNKKRLPTLCNGELYIAGSQVARGYLNREKENAEAFLTNFLDDDKNYKRLYKTGDIVRFLEDGTIDFIGRKDGQVKIRGFRIELSEVEKVISEFPQVKQVTCKDFTDPSGVKFICAYIVSDSKIDFEKVNQFILERKPPYMVPAYMMQIDALPLNQNQKVNKRALPMPELKLEEMIPPRNDDEKAVFEIAKTVLGHDQFGVTNNLFEAGLTSVSSIRFTILLSKKFNKNVENQDLKEHPSIAALTSFLFQKEAEKAYELLSAYPITKTQEGIFVECISKPNSTNYNIPYLFKLPQDMDLQELNDALIKVLDNHPYLKTRLFMNADGEILARREDETSKVTIIEKDIDKKTLIRPFTILDNPLYRIEIYHGKENYLFLDFHHIICDGTSEAIFLEDLNKIYCNQPLEKEEFTGFEVALKERDNRNSDKLDKAREYYKKVLNNLDGDYLMKKDLKTKKEEKLRSLDFYLDIDNKAVQEFIDKNKLTNNAYFNFAFAFTFSKFIYRSDAYYTTIYNGRKSSRLARTISMLVKTLPVYIQYQEDDSVLNKLKETQNLLEGLEENDLYSFSEVSKDYDLAMDVMFCYQGSDFIFDHVGKYKVESLILESDTPKSIFGLDVFLEKKGYRAHFEFDESVYNDDTIKAFKRLFELTLQELALKEKVSSINTLPKEDEKLYEKFNATEVELDPTLTLNKLIEKQAKEKPNKIAVIAKNGKLTYQELNENANRVAHTLVDNGCMMEDRVIMFMPRIKEAYVVRQGIIKSGGAFVPIDPKYPDERVEYIITNSLAKYLITTKEILEAKKEFFKKLSITCFAIENILENPKKNNLDLLIPQTNLCYLIYTSGSTGKPKGVMLTHRNLINYVSDGSNLATRQYRDIGDDCVSCSFASLSFDASLQEECVPLSHGYCAVIASEEEIENPLLLSRTLIENKVTYMFMTPSFVSNLLDIDDFVQALKGFKYLDMGAEAVPIELCMKLRSLGVSATILNGYGPTETTITSTYSIVKDEYMTIGKPLANTKLYLLDKAGHILPINCIGDLTIAGDCVGRGYLGLEEKTKQCFIKVNSLPAYRSGDLARYNSEGNIEFFGRMDNQVKLRGLRVELDEIEKVLNTYPGIKRSLIMVRTNPVDGDYLIAYYVASEEIDKDDLTAHMAKSLTPYMIPKVLMQLDKFPLTPNGKIDKKALPEGEIIVTKKEKHLPKNDLEKKLYDIFKKALGRDDLSVDDDFFEMGGTSLSASKVAMLALTMNLPVSYGDVFEYSSVLALEKHIQGAKGEEVVNDEEEIKDSQYALAHNDVKYVDEIVKERDNGTILLTGATGFLGIHILHELIQKKKKVYTLIRGSKLDPKSRLLALYSYYFDAFDEKEINNYVSIISGDITDEGLYDLLKDEDFDTIINCSALVKHFANDDSIERVNVGGVKNLIDIAIKKKVRLVQISTLSVAGENIDHKFDESFRMKETMLEFDQDISNKYVHSKYYAEKAVLEAVEKGLDGKIIRVGNLMGRNSDGEFQANSLTNGFMRDLRGYVTLKKFPVNSMDVEVDFSPIDEVAKSILLLSTTPKEFTLFHAANSHMVQMGDVVSVLNELGFEIEVVSDDDFFQAMKDMMMDEKKAMFISSLISYSSSDYHTHSFIASNNTFSNKALYHLGFKWPITDRAYLKKSIEAISSLGFFERDSL